MFLEARRWLTAFSLVVLAAVSLQAQRVVMVSFDGLGHQALTTDPVARELTVLRDTAARGAMAEGMQAAFPSTTANSHAALWTGCYGDVNHIAANNPPLLPRAAHTFLERGNGFLSTQLDAETIWVAAARQHVSAVAHQPTQGYPFTPMNSGYGAVVLNGYQTRLLAPHALFTPKNTEARPDGSIVMKHGPLTLRAERRNGGLRIGLAGSAEFVDVRPEPVETEPPRQRPLARRFSAGLPVAQPSPAVLYFRLFELTPVTFRLYVTPLQELAMTEPLPEVFRQAGGFVGNGPEALMQQGKLSAPEYLEAVELVIRQMTRHAAWLHAHYEPRFFQSYLPFPDEFEHEWLGRSRAGDRAVDEFRRWGYIAVNRGAAEFAKLARKTDYLLWVSDHGMAPVSQYVSVHQVLEQAGLGRKVTYLYNSILVNTTDWKGGTVAPAERAKVVEQARQALAAVRDHGKVVFPAFFTPGQDGAQFGIGGPAGGDLYFDLAPGYAASGRPNPAVFETMAHPRGVHGFVPVRPEMLAVCILRGPKVKAGTKWGRIRSIQVVPLVSDLLGIQAPAAAKAASPRS